MCKLQDIERRKKLFIKYHTMRKNYYTVITGRNVVLTSYKQEHVPKYHEWMQSDELRALTASEPLTLYEEYKMQVTWLNDSNKCTFIILEKSMYWESKDEKEAMIGDVNLFFNDPANPKVAEIEIMIAEESYRGQKRGWEATVLMLLYGIQDLKVEKFVVKIGETNEPSINLFKKLEFEFSERSEAFKEVTFSKTVTPEWRQSLEKSVNFIKIKTCDPKVIQALTNYKRALAQHQKEKVKKEQKGSNNEEMKEENKQ